MTATVAVLALLAVMFGPWAPASIPPGERPPWRDRLRSVCACGFWGGRGDMSRQRVSRTVTWGLFVAWAVHDAEELLAIPRWVDSARPRLVRRFPAVPDRVWRRLSGSQAHTAVAIGIMGGLVAAASVAGDRTNGRSPFFQAVLTGFGAHAVPHLTSAAVTGGYTPGLLTTPTVVVPFSWWAWRELRKAGVEKAEIPTAALALVPLSIGVAHASASGSLALGRRLRAGWKSSRSG